MAFALSPFTIEEETVVRVIADTESGKFMGHVYALEELRVK